MIRQVKTISGRLIDERTVELDEAVGRAGDRIEVMLSTMEPDNSPNAHRLLEFLRTLPPGQRTKSSIDEQIGEERASWGVD